MGCGSSREELAAGIRRTSAPPAPDPEPRSLASDVSPSVLVRSLVRAAARGDEAQVAELLRQGASVDKEAENGETPLVRAAAQGRDVVVAQLLAAGARVGQVGRAGDEDAIAGTTALHWSARLGHESTTVLLLGAGADVDAADQRGRTPLLLAAENRLSLIHI